MTSSFSLSLIDEEMKKKQANLHSYSSSSSNGSRKGVGLGPIMMSAQSTIGKVRDIKDIDYE
jgi:hypothetical protein